MQTLFKYKLFDRRSVAITVAVLILIAGSIVWIWHSIGEGGYMTAWLVSFLGAVLALYLLSIPRRIEISDLSVDIHCTVELTKIPLADLQSVRILPREEMRHVVVLLGSFGFFGYYGYYLDTRRWETVKLYCGRWDNFVEITDIYEQRYIVNAEDPEKLVSAIKAAGESYAERLDT